MYYDVYSSVRWKLPKCPLTEWINNSCDTVI